MEPATRVFCKLRVLLLIDGTLDRFGAWVTNLSETGFFAETPARAPTGTGIRFSLYLSDDQPPLPGHATLVWVQDGDGQNPEGIGVKFDPLPPHDRQRLLQFLQGQFQAAPEQPVGSTNPAFRQQVEAEAVSALIAELSQPVVEVEPRHPTDDEPSQPEPHPIEDESPALEAGDEPPPLPDETTPPTDNESPGEPDAEPEEEPVENEPSETVPPWPFRAGPLQSGLKDLIVIQSTLNQTTVAQLSVGDAAELIQLHSTEVKDLFVNAYWRTLGLEGRALALNAILPEELLPATADPIEDLNEWMETAEGWATLIYESCASPSGILILGSSPSFGTLFESLNPAFESADLPVPVMISTGPSLAQGLEKLEQANAPILTLEACGEDLWASLIREDGSVSTWSIPAASQRSAQDTLREAILYCGRLPRTLIAPSPLANLIPADIPIQAVPYAPDQYLELTQIGALRLALGAASD